MSAASLEPEKHLRGRVLVPLVLVLVVIALKWPVLHVPYYWDEAGAYFNPSLWLSSRELLDAFPGRHPAEMFFGHPPLLYLLMACLFKLFGHAPAVGHLPMILFAALGVLYTYRLGVLLHGRDVGVGAALLLLSFPLFFAQSGMFLGDVPAAACGVAAVYYYFTGSRYRYLLWATAAVLVKEHAALLIAVMVLYDWCAPSRKNGTRSGKLVHALPLAILAAFFLAQKLMTGAFLPNPYFNSNSFVSVSAAQLIFKTAFANYWAFFAQGRFLLTLVTAVAVWRFRRGLPAHFYFFGLVMASYVAAYSFIYFLPRYMLIIAPFLCLAGSASLALLLHERSRYVASVATLGLAAVLLPEPRGQGYENFETSMKYLDVVSLHRQAAAHLQRVAGSALIYAPWPLPSVWGSADFGYLAVPLNVTTDPSRPWRYVVATHHADRAQSEAIDAVIRNGGVDKIAHFDCSGRVLDVFARKEPAMKGHGP
jgi:4-amino-4-deoxy-L-arabinose transferase-like glycosyltransferase